MLKHEKKAFWKFFGTYFGSVAILILVAGSFYFEDRKKGLLEKEHFSMIEYVKVFKSGKSTSNSDGITHKLVDMKIELFSMDNFKIEEKYFIKYLPYNWENRYIEIKKSKDGFNEKIELLIYKIILLQTLLLFIFASISYFLSKKALQPMQDAIKKLDNFSKDLIHDLNTPITSIKLNMNILDKHDEFKENKALSRIKKSVEDISQLHNNLTTLLEEHTMIMQMHDISEIVEEVVLTHRKVYKNIDFTVEVDGFSKKVNQYAFKQVLSNLVSNACKYNKKDGFVKIYVRDDSLYIEDNGIGIKNVEKVFNRSYHENESGHGIGLDIVKRLCDAMGIDISVKSEVDVGSVFVLGFRG